MMGVASRPLFLFIANNYLTQNATQGLAVALLAASLGMVATAADPHRRFYARHFAIDRVKNGLLFYVYVASHLLLTTLGAICVLVITAHFGASIALGLGAIVYFLSEKIADELLRLRLFEREFALWGRSLITRSVIQFAGFGAMLLIWGHGVSGPQAVIALAVGNMLVFLPQLPRSVWRLMSPRRIGTVQRLARRGAVALVNGRLLWAVALASAGIGYVDRTILLVTDVARLSVFTLIVMCFSIIQLSIDFFYVSRHRRDFLQHRVSLRQAILNREFAACIGGAVLTASVASAGVLRFSRNGAGFPLTYILAIAALQTSIAIAIVPREISYWTREYRRILHVELAFWGLFGAAAIASWVLRLEPTQVVAAAAICAAIRLIMHMVVAARAVSAPVSDRAAEPALENA